MADQLDDKGDCSVAAVIDPFDAVVQTPVEGRPPQNAAPGTGAPLIPTGCGV
jgi:hypothetical protein